MNVAPFAIASTAQVVSGRLPDNYRDKLLTALTYFVVSGRLPDNYRDKLLTALTYFVVSGRLELPTSTLSV